MSGRAKNIMRGSIFPSVKFVFAFEMPGKRYDIGDLESYEEVKKEYKGIIC